MWFLDKSTQALRPQAGVLDYDGPEEVRSNLGLG
jgi:hypothetical protein